ncbi:MAG TPA: hypothetical protein VJU84_04055 [Pyrinomonadaceae bacterium]|nr:hypothetical protein [Pyrinomonadaceae bacterium]
MATIIAQFQRDAGIERQVTPHMLRHGRDLTSSEWHGYSSRAGVLRTCFYSYNSTVYARG